MTSARITDRRLELATVVLLALGALGTAWAAYQSRQWTGEQSQGYSAATAARITENRAAARAGRQEQIDISTFIQWIDARSGGDAGLVAFYRARVRPEFEPAFAAWLATRPFANQDAPPTPFAMPQYRLAATAEAERLERTAAAASERAKDANQRADNYMLAVVLFASALFFAGISSKLEDRALRVTMLGLAGLLLIGTLIWIATFPVRLTT